MRSLVFGLLLIWVAGLPAQPADQLAQAVTLQTPPEGLALSEVAAQLAEQTGLPIDLEVAGDPRVVGSFQGVPLWVVLTHICSANGLDWDPTTAGVSIDEARLARVYPIDTTNQEAFELLIRSGELDSLVHTGDAEGGDESFYVYDPNLGILSVSATSAAIDALDTTLGSLASEEVSREVETRVLLASPRRADRLEELLRANLEVTDQLDGDEETPLLERGVRREGNAILVTDTPENLQRLDLLLQRQSLLEAAANEARFDTREYNLLPAGIAPADILADGLAGPLLAQIQGILGLEPGQEAGGRRLHLDDSAKRVTVTADPTDLLRIELAIAQNTAAHQRRVQTVQIAEAARQQAQQQTRQQGPSMIQRLAMETAWAPRPSGVRIGQTLTRSEASGNVVTTSLREGRDFEWRGYRFNLLRTRNTHGRNAEAEILISDLAGRNSDRVATLRTHRSVITGDVRVRVTDIKTGGRVSLEITDLR